MQNIKDVKQIPADMFLWEESSRLTGKTICGLSIEENGDYRLPGYTGLTMVGYSREVKGCDESTTAVLLENTAGERFWMHVCDFREVV